MNLDALINYCQFLAGGSCHAVKLQYRIPARILVRELVDSGRYASASEVLRDGLRLLEEREEQRWAKLDALREAIREGRSEESHV